jgi:hypothetical protein
LAIPKTIRASATVSGANRKTTGVNDPDKVPASLPLQIPQRKQKTQKFETQVKTATSREQQPIVRKSGAKNRPPTSHKRKKSASSPKRKGDGVLSARKASLATVLINEISTNSGRRKRGSRQVANWWDFSWAVQKRILKIRAPENRLLADVKVEKL